MTLADFGFGSGTHVKMKRNQTGTMIVNTGPGRLRSITNEELETLKTCLKHYPSLPFFLRIQSSGECFFGGVGRGKN